MADAEVTKGALYHHFTGKQDLYGAVLAAVEDDARQQIRAHIEDVSDPWERALMGLREFLTIARGEEYRRIVILEGPAVLGYERFREQEERSTFGLVQDIVGPARRPTSCPSRSSRRSPGCSSGRCRPRRPRSRSPRTPSRHPTTPRAPWCSCWPASGRCSTTDARAEGRRAWHATVGARQRWIWTDPPSAGTSSIHTWPAGSVTSLPPTSSAMVSSRPSLTQRPVTTSPSWKICAAPVPVNFVSGTG